VKDGNAIHLENSPVIVGVFSFNGT
jgi:hypothetical protein